MAMLPCFLIVQHIVLLPVVLVSLLKVPPHLVGPFLVSCPRSFGAVEQTLLVCTLMF